MAGCRGWPHAFVRYQRVGGPVRSPHQLAATCQPPANGSRSGGVALLRQSRSALRRSYLGHGHGQAIGAGIDDSALWKAEETIIGLSQFAVLSPFARFCGCHLSPFLSPFTLCGILEGPGGRAVLLRRNRFVTLLPGPA